MNHISSIQGFIRRQGRNALILILIALVGAFLAGCVPITPEKSEAPRFFSCARFGFSHWKEFNFGLEPSSDDLVATVRRLYQVDRDQITVESDADGQFPKVVWTDNDVDYFAHFSPSGQFMNVEVHWGREQPTFAEVVDCLGPPISSHEGANGTGSESGSVHFWAYETDEAWTIPGYVTSIILEGVSSLDTQSSAQANQPDYRVKQLNILAMPTPRQTVESSDPSSCAKLSLLRRREFSFGVDTQDDVVATVVRLWGIDREQIPLGGMTTERFPPVRWNDADEEILYTAFFADGQLGRVLAMFNPALALIQVIDCMGPPDYYTTSGGPGSQVTNLLLWYVEEGFVVAGRVLHPWSWQKPLEAIPPDFGMDRFHVLPAGSEQMVRIFDYLEDDGNPALCVLGPWPGSIEAIEIREDFFTPCSETDSD